MIYSHEVQHMCVVKKGANHQCAPIPEEGKWVRATQISDISGLTHGIGWCAPKQGGCKLTLHLYSVFLFLSAESAKRKRLHPNPPMPGSIPPVG